MSRRVGNWGREPGRGCCWEGYRVEDGRLEQAKGRVASLRWGMARGKWARIQNRKMLTSSRGPLWKEGKGLTDVREGFCGF